jgi:YNFM family putative membrane transporter
MKKFDLFIVLSVIYATQPLPQLSADKFEISIIKASYFTTVIILFLAISPIIYGYILEKIYAKKMLFISLIILLSQSRKTK